MRPSNRRKLFAAKSAAPELGSVVSSYNFHIAATRARVATSPRNLHDLKIIIDGRASRPGQNGGSWTITSLNANQPSLLEHFKVVPQRTAEDEERDEPQYLFKGFHVVSIDIQGEELE
jgi:hypothetical protein